MFARLMGLKTVSPKELHRWIQEGTASAVDVNSRQSWMQARVPGAIHLDAGGFEERDLPPDKHARLVFYCSNYLCSKGPNAARRARKMGYDNVHVMSAGISGWLGANLPTESGA